MDTGAVGDVVIDAHGKGIGLLEHHADVAAQLVDIHAGSKNVLAVVFHFSGDFDIGNQVVHAV